MSRRTAGARAAGSRRTPEKDPAVDETDGTTADATPKASEATDAELKDDVKAKATKARDAEPTNAEARATKPKDDEKDDDRARSRPVVLTALLVAAAAFLAAGVVFLVRAHDLNSDTSSSNDAVSDRATTAQVIGQVSTALEQVLSYDYTKPQVAQAAASKSLAGAAPKQYQLLIKQLGDLSKGQKLTLVAKVVTAGVITLHGSSATLLVFVDQQSTRADNGQSSVSAGQVHVTAQRYGTTWKVTGLKPL